MILFGYKSKIGSILRGLSAIAVGLVLLMENSRVGYLSTTELIVKIIAVSLMVFGAVTLVYGWIHRNEKTGNLMWINAVVNAGLGLLLFFYPAFISGFIITAVGVALICLGGLQLIVMAGAMSLIGAGFASLIMSALAIIGGGMLIFSNLGQSLLAWIAGIAMIVYGAQELIQTWKLRDAEAKWEVLRAEEVQKARFDKSVLESAKEVDFIKEEDADDTSVDSQ